MPTDAPTDASKTRTHTHKPFGVPQSTSSHKASHHCPGICHSNPARVVDSGERLSHVYSIGTQVDGLREEALGGGKIGTTKRGIGPAYATKAYRSGMRVCDLYNEDIFVERMTRLFSDAKAAHPSFSGDLESELAKCVPSPLPICQGGLFFAMTSRRLRGTSNPKPPLKNAVCTSLSAARANITTVSDDRHNCSCGGHR